MLLMLDIDDETASLVDGEADDEGITESIVMRTFGLETAEVIRVDGYATYIGVVLKRRLTLSDIIAGYHESITWLRTYLRQTSTSVAFRQ